MGFGDILLTGAKVVAKTGLVATGCAVYVLNGVCKEAIKKGATPTPGYDSGKADGMAKTLFELNKKIKL